MKLLALIAALASVAVAGADASAFLATDKNFDSAVMNSGKHVFVKYLAPWCVRAMRAMRCGDGCAGGEHVSVANARVGAGETRDARAREGTMDVLTMVFNRSIILDFRRAERLTNRVSCVVARRR